MFIREHNRIATEISKVHPTWSDEEIYQESRKWNIAYLQSICFNEYLPILGVQLEKYIGYKSDVNPSIDTFFASIAYRYGHSEVSNFIYRIDDNGEEISDGHILLHEAYFNPSKALNNGTSYKM